MRIASSRLVGAIAVFTVFGVHTAGAQAAPDSLILSQTDVEQRVLRDAPSVRAARLDSALARGDRITAGLRPNPSINVQADILPSLHGGPYDPNQKQYGLQLVLPFERGDKRAQRTTLADAGLTAAAARARDTDREALVAARLAWIDLQAAYAVLRVSESTLASYDRLVALSRNRLDARQISEQEFARVAVERGRAAVDVDERRLDATQASAALGVLLGTNARIVPRDTLAPDTTAVLGATRLDGVSDSVLVERALSTRPDVMAARAAVQVAQADIAVQKSLAVPDVSVSLDFAMQQTVAMYGASLSVPLPRYNRNQGERAKASTRFEQARLVLDATEREARSEVLRAVSALRSRRQSLTRFEREDGDAMLRRAASTKSAAEFAYRSGATSLLELLDAERSYDDTRRAYVDAVAQYNRSLARLAEAIGRVPGTTP